MIDPRALLASLQMADEVLDLSGKLVDFMKQRHPELNTVPVPDEGEAMDQAREEALRRMRGED